jgi:hypothetical protein
MASSDLVALMGVLCIFGLPIVGWIIARWLAHRERMEMIRAGMMPPISAGRMPRGREWRQMAPPPPPSPSNSDSCSDPYTLETAQRQLRKGITLAFIGMALTIGLSFIGLGDGSWRPGPWLLGGLIPLFIGLAQVATAVLSGAQIGQARAWGPHVPPMPPIPPGPLPSGSASGPHFDGPYTYRPGNTQELQPPFSPPERRG